MADMQQLLQILSHPQGVHIIQYLQHAQEQKQLQSVYERNKVWAKLQPTYATSLSPEQESQFQSWVQQNKVPWQDVPTADYDMRGYWKSTVSGKEIAPLSVNPNDNQPHYPDTYKTPYHESFSNESQYADPIKAPSWNDKDQLVSPDGTVVFDERAKKSKL